MSFNRNLDGAVLRPAAMAYQHTIRNVAGLKYAAPKAGAKHRCAPAAELSSMLRCAQTRMKKVGVTDREPGADEFLPASLPCMMLCTINHTLPMSTTMTIRLDDDVKDRLDVLAGATQRSKSFLAAEAIRAFVETNEWQIGEIQAALKEADAGNFASDKDVVALAKKWKVNAR